VETERRCKALLIKAIDDYGIYDNAELKRLILNLEQKYKINSEVEFFNELVNFSKNKDIPYHGWFKYREGFSNNLIQELIKRSAISKGEFVLDPFCGSGTTVVEAAIEGYSGVGIDINPVAAFVSEVKCRSYTDIEIEDIKKHIDIICKKIRIKEPDEAYQKKYQDVKKFFNETNYDSLLCIRETIDSEKDIMGSKIYEFFLCAYICIIEEVSNRKRDGNGLKTLATKIEDVYLYYENKIRSMFDDIQKYRIDNDVTARVEFGNAMELSKTVRKWSQIMQKPLGAIMYSPPYANSFDYFESYKMEVILADYAKDMKGINIFRQQAVESFIGRTDKRNKTRDFIEWMADEIEKAIPLKEKTTGKRDVRTRKVPKMIKGYFTDMEKVIEESSMVLPKGKKCYIVVDQSAYLGKIVPTDLFLAAIAEDYGFAVSEIIVCRNAKTSSQQIQKYPYLRDSLRESIVVLEKR
jgi:site-specific DNA-methyltransferase (adenine-specific)